MLNSKNSPSVNTKLKAMYSKKLTKEDLEDLMKQQNLKEAIYLLKSKIDSLDNLRVDAKRLEIEAELDKMLISDILKITKYIHGKNKEIWDMYFKRYELKIIKVVWNNLLDTENNNLEEKEKNIQIWTNEIFRNLKGIESLNSKEEVLSLITDKKAKNILNSDYGIFERENALDKLYFEDFLQILKDNNKQLYNVTQEEIDLNNIVWTYRMAQYKDFDYKTFIINDYKYISNNLLEKVQEAQNKNELQEILKDTHYKNIIKDDIEKDIKRYLYKIYKRIFKAGMLDFSIVIAYFRLLEFKRENIIAILEGIRYKLQIQEIEKRIIY